MSFSGPDGDLNAIVADFGSATTKIGFAGRDSPHALLSTVNLAALSISMSTFLPTRNRVRIGLKPTRCCQLIGPCACRFLGSSRPALSLQKVRRYLIMSLCL